jgi:hypothetical protein
MEANIDGDFILKIINDQATAGHNKGLRIQAGTSSGDYALEIRNQADTQALFLVQGDGAVVVNNSLFSGFDPTVPTTIAFGDAAAVGTQTTAARRDHKHGMAADPVAALAFTTSNPSAVAQSGAVTFTTTRARLVTLGKFVTYVCQITITQIGTSGSAIAVTLPFTWAANAGQAYGAFRYDRASGATHFGNASQAASTNQIAFAVPTLGFLGINPAFATANGDILWFTVSGETT